MAFSKLYMLISTSTLMLSRSLTTKAHCDYYSQQSQSQQQQQQQQQQQSHPQHHHNHHHRRERASRVYELAHTIEPLETNAALQAARHSARNSKAFRTCVHLTCARAFAGAVSIATTVYFVLALTVPRAGVRAVRAATGLAMAVALTTDMDVRQARNVATVHVLLNESEEEDRKWEREARRMMCNVYPKCLLLRLLSREWERQRSVEGGRMNHLEGFTNGHDVYYDDYE